MFKKFIERPVLSTVISIIIVILGVLGIVSLPVSQYPDIAPPTVVVSASYQGANADVILKKCHCSARRADQWCGRDDIYDLFCNQ